MEWLWVLALLAIVFGPVGWALLRGRGSHGPEHEDGTNVTGYAMIIKDILTRGRR